MQYENYCIVRRYRDKYKLIILYNYNPDRSPGVKGTAGNDAKLEQNISRARQKIFEYAYCNDWEYFVTMTLNPQKYDRYNLKAWQKSLSQWLRNYRRRTGQKIDYLLIPEQHKDGAWHIHGLINGIPFDRLQPFEQGTPLYGSDYLNWPDYQKKYGYISVGAVGNHEAVSKYITKYITKDMARLNTELNAHLYYASLGLQTSEVLHQDTVYHRNLDVSPDYENEYCAVKWCGYDDAMRVYLADETFDLNDFEEIEVQERK